MVRADDGRSLSVSTGDHLDIPSGGKSTTTKSKSAAGCSEGVEYEEKHEKRDKKELKDQNGRAQEKGVCGRRPQSWGTNDHRQLIRSPEIVSTRFGVTPQRTGLWEARGSTQRSGVNSASQIGKGRRDMRVGKVKGEKERMGKK